MTWRPFKRVFEDDTVYIREMKMSLTKINNGTGSEGEGGLKDGYIS
jgi:hypothetical protein